MQTLLRVNGRTRLPYDVGHDAAQHPYGNNLQISLEAQPAGGGDFIDQLIASQQPAILWKGQATTYLRAIFTFGLGMLCASRTTLLDYTGHRGGVKSAQNPWTRPFEVLLPWTHPNLYLTCA